MLLGHVGVRALVPLAVLLLDGPRAALGALLLQELGLRLARRLGRDGDFLHLAAPLFALAFGLRAAVSLALHAYSLLVLGQGGALQLDDATYDQVAAWLVRIAAGEPLAIFPGHQYVLDGLYLYVLAGLYALFGYAPTLPKLLNAALMAVGAVLLADTARRAFSPRAGALAGILAAVLPTLVIWSALTLKDSLVLFAALVGLAGTLRLATPAWASGAVALATSLALLADLRVTLGATLVLAALVLLLARFAARVPRRHAALAALLLALLAVGAVAALRTWVPPDAEIARLARPSELAEALSARREEEAAQARSQIEAPSSAGTGTGATDSPAEFVHALSFALLAPAPWQARGLRDLAASAEMLGWYVLLAAAPFAWAARPRVPSFALALGAYGLITWVVLALTEGNLGNLLRHRMMLTPPLLVFGAAGLAWLAAQRRWALPARQRDGAVHARRGAAVPQ